MIPFSLLQKMETLFRRVNGAIEYTNIPLLQTQTGVTSIYMAGWVRIMSASRIHVISVRRP